MTRNDAKAHRESGAIRERSGNVDDDRRLVKFLYVLMRDELPPGKVEDLMLRHERAREVAQFSNGWLAQHAQDLADRLTDDDA